MKCRILAVAAAALVGVTACGEAATFEPDSGAATSSTSHGAPTTSEASGAIIVVSGAPDDIVVEFPNVIVPGSGSLGGIGPSPIAGLEELETEVLGGGLLAVVRPDGDALEVVEVLEGRPDLVPTLDELRSRLTVEGRAGIEDGSIPMVLVAVPSTGKLMSAAGVDDSGDVYDIGFDFTPSIDVFSVDLSRLGRKLFTARTYALVPRCAQQPVMPEMDSPLDALDVYFESAIDRADIEARAAMVDQAAELADSQTWPKDPVTDETVPIDHYDVYRQLVAGVSPEAIDYHPTLPVIVNARGLDRRAKLAFVDSNTGALLGWYSVSALRPKPTTAYLGYPSVNASIDVWLLSADAANTRLGGCAHPDDLAATSITFGTPIATLTYGDIVESDRTTVHKLNTD